MQCESMSTPVVHCEFRRRETSDARIRRGPQYWIVRCSPDVKRDYQSQQASRAAVPLFPSCTARFTSGNYGSHSAVSAVLLGTVGLGVAHSSRQTLRMLDSKRLSSSARSGGGPSPSLISCARRSVRSGGSFPSRVYRTKDVCLACSLLLGLLCATA